MTLESLRVSGFVESSMELVPLEITGLVISLAHQLLEKLGEVPSETFVKKYVTLHVSHIIF